MMKTFALLILTSLLFGCDFVEDVDAEHGDCIKARISAFKHSTEACTDGASIYSYQFQGGRVYVFNPGNCVADFFSDVYDEDCNLVCSLGGIAGNIMCNEENFSDKATDETLVWKN